MGAFVNFHLPGDYVRIGGDLEVDKRTGEERRRDMLRRYIMDRRTDVKQVSTDLRDEAERRFKLERRLYMDRRVTAASIKELT